MFKEAVYLAKERFDKLWAEGKFKGIAEVITGDTKQVNRDDIVRRFQKGEVRLLICTIQTAGQGITLHKADTCVFLDRAWSPAENEQAEDRLHRMGQKNAVNVILLTVPGTVDEDVNGTLWRKQEWVNQMLGG
jgi:SNF2 family DNA or RNA helicase